jgi:hypothetical protein
MGAGNSILAAAEEPGIRALVADSSYANASDLIIREVARKTVFPEWSVPNPRAPSPPESDMSSTRARLRARSIRPGSAPTTLSGLTVHRQPYSSKV